MSDELIIRLTIFTVLAAVVAVSVVAVRGFVAALRSNDLSVRARAKKRAGISLLVVLAICGSLLLSEEVDLRIGDAGRFAIRNGRTIQVHPSLLTFQVPAEWLEWDNQFHNNFHLAHRDLRRVRIGHGEWDFEYGKVVNAILPFEHCAAHVGGEGWGFEAVSFSDLQLRVYVTDLSLPDIVSRIEGPGLKAATEIADSNRSGWGSSAHAASTRDKDWLRATIDYPLWYGDYGGTGVFHFHMKDIGKYRVVMVFMGIDQEKEEDFIMKSVRFAQN